MSDLNTKKTYRFLKAIVALLFIALLAEQQIIPSELIADEEIEFSEVLEDEMEDKELDLYSLFFHSVSYKSIKDIYLSFSTSSELSSFWEDVHLNRQNPPPRV